MYIKKRRTDLFKHKWPRQEGVQEIHCTFSKTCGAKKEKIFGRGGKSNIDLPTMYLRDSVLQVPFLCKMRLGMLQSCEPCNICDDLVYGDM